MNPQFYFYGLLKKVQLFIQSLELTVPLTCLEIMKLKNPSPEAKEKEARKNNLVKEAL